MPELETHEAVAKPSKPIEAEDRRSQPTLRRSTSQWPRHRRSDADVAPVDEPVAEAQVEPADVAPIDEPVAEGQVEPADVAPIDEPVAEAQAEPTDVAPIDEPVAESQAEPADVAPVDEPVAEADAEVVIQPLGARPPEARNGQAQGAAQAVKEGGPEAAGSR